MSQSHHVDELLQRSRTASPLTAGGKAALAAVYAEAARFFTQPEEIKLGHGSDDFNFGYRPYGRQFSVSPDRPDENASFVYRADNPSTVPNYQAITVAPFLRALHDYWQVAASAADQLLADLASHYSYPDELPFRTSSYLEINWYLPDSDRDLLQDRHEDGHLFTLATSDGPGLELEEPDGTMTPSRHPKGALLVMPGGVLSGMTDGEIKPLFHQVRNHHLPRRTTVLLLVNPPLDRKIEPYIPGAEQVDTAELARAGGAMFGLPLAPLLPDAH